MTFFTYISAIWLATLLYFVLVQKSLFGVLAGGLCPVSITPRGVLGAYRHGVATDGIGASYLTGLPWLIAAVYALVPNSVCLYALYAYYVAVGIGVGALTVSDPVIYRYWNQKIDATVLPYLRRPRAVAASLPWWGMPCVLFAILAAGALWCVPCVWLTHLYGTFATAPSDVVEWLFTPVLILVAGASMAMDIRGVGVRPNNPSMASFSPTAFFNHWALNPLYSIVYSLNTRDAFSGRFRTFDTDDEAYELIRGFYPTTGNTNLPLLKVQRPNLLVVVWESLGAEFFGGCGGRGHVTPCLANLAVDGVTFTNCTAASFRTDRGLVGVLTGLPAQPTASVIRYTRKVAALPGLADALRREGYNTLAIHGGDMQVMHKADLYLASGHERLVTQKDFDSWAPKCKWGVHDHVVADRTFTEIKRLQALGKPWMVTLQTLSSHEPFVVPYKRLSDPADNSMAYTDEALGRLWRNMRFVPEIWDNTLIVVVGDHTLNRPQPVTDRVAHSHIPLVMGGGVVARRGVMIDSIVAQTDIPATVLGQMGLPHDQFLFSRDVTADTYTRYGVFHAFGNGVMWRDDTGATVVDTISMRPTDGADPTRQSRALALLQILYSHIAKL